MKKYLLIGSAVLLVLSIVGFFSLRGVPSQVKQETSLVNYTQSGQFSYNIYLKPSYLYGPAPQANPPDPRYPAAATGSIDFTYTFTPANKTSTSASVEAVLENPGLWHKTLTLVPQSFANGDLTLAFSLDPDQINALFAEIEKETGIVPSTRTLSINANITSGADRFTQTLPIKLDKNVIQVSDELLQPVSAGNGKFSYVVKRKPVVAASADVPDARYPAQIVNSLDFTYGFTPSGPVNGKATVEAVLENPGIWQKSIIVAPSVDVTGPATLNFKLDLAGLQKQFDDIDAQTKLTTSTRLVTLKASLVTDSVTFVQTLPLTLEKDILSVPGNLGLQDPSGSGLFNYTVNLKPNSIYGTQTLQPAAPATANVDPFPPGFDINSGPGPVVPAAAPALLAPGQTAFVKLVDKMDASFLYQFKADQPVSNLNTDVELLAVLEAPQSWTKQFSLLKTSKSGNFGLNFPLDITGYSSLMDSIRTETGVSPESYNLSLVANLHTTGQTAYGPIDERISPTLKGVIKANVLTWDKQLTTAQSGSITSAGLVSNPVRYLGLPAGTAMLLAGILMAILAPLTAYFLFLYLRSGSARNGLEDLEAFRIKRKYAQRIIQTSYQTSPNANVIAVGTIEDLVKTADELGKPILYSKTGGNGVFYVLDGTGRYQYATNSG